MRCCRLPRARRRSPNLPGSPVDSAGPGAVRQGRARRRGRWPATRRRVPGPPDPDHTDPATGAIASALLGSPPDAALVSSVLLTNAAVGAAATACRADAAPAAGVQDPLARRGLALDDRRSDDVPAAALRPGDIIEVRPARSCPPMLASSRPSTSRWTNRDSPGESLLVSKQTDPTPRPAGGAGLHDLCVAAPSSPEPVSRSSPPSATGLR